MRPWTVKTKDWKAGRRWARRNALASPGVTYTIVRDRRRISYRYEDGLMYCTGTGNDRSDPVLVIKTSFSNLAILVPKTLDIHGGVRYNIDSK